MDTLRWDGGSITLQAMQQIDPQASLLISLYNCEWSSRYALRWESKELMSVSTAIEDWLASSKCPAELNLVVSKVIFGSNRM